MYKCNYCDKQLKSEGGRKRHENSCKMKSNEEEYVKPKEITTTLVGESDYYVGHPRRLIKLNGLRSRTHDKVERLKIERMIIELRNAR